MRFPFACLRLSPTPIILDSYSPQSVKGRALDEEIQALRRKGAVEPAPPTPGYGGLADHRPVHPEPECGSDLFSDGDISDGSARCSQERLDGLHRSEGCFPSDPDPPCVSQVPQVHSRREDLAVPGPLLQSVHSPTGVHSCDGTCVRVPRGQDCTLDLKCVECSLWPSDVFDEYVKHRRSLISKSRSKKSRKDSWALSRVSHQW